jgi:hypothetical protein
LSKLCWIDKEQESEGSDRILLCLEEDCSLQVVEVQARQEQSHWKPEWLDFSMIERLDWRKDTLPAEWRSWVTINIKYWR